METLAVEVSSGLLATSFSLTTSISVDFAGVAHTYLQTNAIIVTMDTEMSYLEYVRGHDYHKRWMDSPWIHTNGIFTCWVCFEPHLRSYVALL